MKNTFRLFAAMAVCAMLFVGCKKEKPEPTPEPTIETGLEGQFMPERKIASIESFNLINEDSLSSFHKTVYEWNGDLLYKITETQFEGTWVSTRIYQYDSLNRVSEIKLEREENPSIFTFIYEGKELAKINETDENDSLIANYVITRTDGKVTGITATHWYTDPANVSSKTFVWDGDNIAQNILSENGNAIPTNNTFDDKVNPRYGLLTSGYYNDIEETFSVNNILTSEMELTMGMSLVITNEYEYDDKGYPIKMTSSKGYGASVITQVLQYTYME